MTAKLGDFGFARPLPKIPEGKSFIRTTETCGTACTTWLLNLSEENWERKWMYLDLEL